MFQHTAARRRLVSANRPPSGSIGVSTHSRPKAAGHPAILETHLWFGFNTQPPEGGWVVGGILPHPLDCFNTQPPEGGWYSYGLSVLFCC